MNKKVLFIDDNKDFFDLFYDLAIESGFDPTFTENGYEALLFVKEDKVNAIITDIQMPIMDGMELIKHARAFNPRIPIIALTGLHYSGEKYAKKLGADAVFSKPFKMEDIVDQLKTLLK